MNNNLVAKTNWYSEDELKTLGFKSIGKGCQISRDAKFYGIENMSLGHHVKINDFATLSGNITIGNYSAISGYTTLSGNITLGNVVQICIHSFLDGSAGITMEDFSGVAQHCSVLSSSSDYSGKFMITIKTPDEFLNLNLAPIVIKKHAVLAAHSVILPGVTMAEGSVTGVGTCLRKSTKPFTIYLGNPAKIFMPRKQNILELEKEFRSKYPEYFEE